MKIEILFLAVTAFFITNIHTDGKLLAKALTYKKYYQMIFVFCIAVFLYWLVKNDPNKARTLLKTSNTYMKYLPLDSNTSNVIVPIIDFTSSINDNFGDAIEQAYSPIIPPVKNDKKNKRSVSEGRKKYVASRQKWKCEECNRMLNATFEIDHIVRLDRGGTNDVDNLVALCRECHGNKTLLENM